MVESETGSLSFATLGMFIIDTFQFDDLRCVTPQIGGGGTYTNLGARIWLPPHETSMIVDRGHDFTPDITAQLDSYGPAMWNYRDNPDKPTARAVNIYTGEHRGFKYLTERTQITPRDLKGTKTFAIHFICSPARAAIIMGEIKAVAGWSPKTIYEPIPNRCVPEELPALLAILPEIYILSPNADEAFSMLSLDKSNISRPTIEVAAAHFLSFGVGTEGTGWVIVRSGELGAYVANKKLGMGKWVSAYWGKGDEEKLVDVTGCGNAFLGGVAAGLKMSEAEDDVYEATLYGTVSASFIIEQQGLPVLSIDDEGVERWNGDLPNERLAKLRARLEM